MAKKPAGNPPITADARIILLVGEDAFLAGEYTSQVREILTKAHGPDGFDTIRFDGSSTPVGEVLDECRTFGLMQQHKLIVVDQADQLVKEDARPAMERYAQGPSDNATLVLRATRWYKGKLDELIDAVGVKIELADITPDQAVNWCMRRAEKRHHAQVGRDVAELLVQRVGVDLGRLDTELQKLATFAGGGEGAATPAVVTKAMAAELVGVTREEEAWGLQSVIIKGQTSDALHHLRLILDNSRKDAVVPATWACLDLARKLHGAAAGLKSGANPWQLAGKLKLWGPTKDAVFAAAGKLPPRRAAEMLAAGVDADRRSKSGLGEPERNLERLVIRFTQALRG